MRGGARRGDVDGVAYGAAEDKGGGLDCRCWLLRMEPMEREKGLRLRGCSRDLAQEARGWRRGV